MKNPTASFVALLTILMTTPYALAQESPQQKPTLNCNIGPISKTYGGTQWLVYSCSDERTVVIISAPGNPATPFYFTFYPKENGYRLGGEGTERKDLTDAAYADLNKLNDGDIAELIRETKAH